MIRIGLLSDTHGFLHPELDRIFQECHQIWHAGDFGNIQTAESLESIKPLTGVYGNIDDQSIRQRFPKYQRFMAEDVDVLMTHIGGYPGNYNTDIRQMLKISAPRLFISGHSHILKVMYDKKYDLLHINPGSAGRAGFHKVITMIRFIIDGSNIRDLEVIEFPK
jgi:uncharacterized protein